MTIQDLAALMGQSESDVAGFVEGVRVWTNRGYSLERAIEKHMQQMTRFVNNAVELSQLPAMRQAAVDCFFPA